MAAPSHSAHHTSRRIPLAPSNPAQGRSGHGSVPETQTRTSGPAEHGRWDDAHDNWEHELKYAEEFLRIGQNEQPDLVTDEPITLKKGEGGKGVSLRTGSHEGTYAQGSEELKSVDNGRAIITTRRMLFAGQKRTREWDFTRLVGIRHEPEWTLINVANREKVSGILYPEVFGRSTRFLLDLALAEFKGTRGEFVEAWGQHVHELRRQEPKPLATDPFT